MPQVPEKPLLVFTRVINLSQGIVALQKEVVARSEQEADEIIIGLASDGHFDDEANEAISNTEGWQLESIQSDSDDTLPRLYDPDKDYDVINADTIVGEEQE